mgnify:CR=1 FL=1
MKNNFPKPQLKFPATPAINMYIESRYKKVETFEDLIEFLNWCIEEMKLTKNPVKRHELKKVTCLLNFLFSKFWDLPINKN